LEIPFGQACAGGVLMVIGLGAYFFAEHWLYAQASQRLGYCCELRPQPAPHTAHYDVDLVITGSYNGRPFTLYRERHNRVSSSSSSARPTNGSVIRSVLEWPDTAITAAPFRLYLSRQQTAPADAFGIRASLNKAVAATREMAGYKPEVRETLSDLPQAKRDELAALMPDGLIEGEPGYLALIETPASPLWLSRAGKFPYPWEIATYVERADRIRRVFTA
jgi:hypothetical protein